MSGPAKRSHRAACEAVEPVILDEGDEQLVTCPHCGRFMFRGEGLTGFSHYTVRRYGNHWLSTRTRRHYPDGCDREALRRHTLAAHERDRVALPAMQKRLVANRRRQGETS